MTTADRPRGQRGEGAVTFDKSVGLWTGRLDLGRNAAGKRVRVKVTGRSRAEARKNLKDAWQRRSDGVDLTAQTRTFAQVAELWLARGLPAETSDLTRANYASLIRKRLLPQLGPIKVTALRADDIEDVLDQVAEAGLSGRTLRLILNLAQRILDFARRRDIVTRNVAEVVHAPRGPRRERKGMTVEEAGKLLDALADERLGPMLTIQLLLGLRPGEVAALRWQDLDVTADPPTLRVSHSLRRTTAGMLLVEPKTPSSYRILGLSPRIVEAVLAQDRQQATDAANQPAWSNPDDLMFTAESGSPLDPSNTRRALARIGRSVGLPGLHPHALRHATASLLSNAGVRLEDIADTLGHKSITVTADVYRHNISPTRTAHLTLDI